MGSQLPVEVSGYVDQPSFNMLLVEENLPLRVDLVAILRQHFPSARINYLHKSDNTDPAQVIWQQYDLVLFGCYRLMDGLLSALESQEQNDNIRPPPVIVLLGDTVSMKASDGELPEGGRYHRGSDLCFAHNVSATEFMAGVSALLKVRRLLQRYPLSLPGWELKSVLHDSENAVVFLAEDQWGGKSAIKRFKFEAIDISERALNYFSEDAGTLISQPASPVLVRLLDAGVSRENAVYLVMEYLPGITLSERLTSAFGEGDLELRLYWFRQIMQALAIIHEVGLLHRDLKSSNILMRADDSPALLDLGVEIHLLVESGFLREDEIYGTPFYISPERIIGEPASVQSDLYAAGILFHEILTGEKPFQGRDLAEILQGHMFGAVPQLPAKFAPYQPLLSKLLLKSPESRIDSAGAVLAMLDSLSG